MPSLSCVHKDPPASMHDILKPPHAFGAWATQSRVGVSLLAIKPKRSESRLAVALAGEYNVAQY